MLTGDPSVQQFSDALLQVGNGQVPCDQDGFINLPQELTNLVDSRTHLLEKLYPNLQEKCRLGQQYYDWLCERAILAPRNDVTKEINTTILEQLPGRTVQFKSFDKTLGQ